MKTEFLRKKAIFLAALSYFIVITNQGAYCSEIAREALIRKVQTKDRINGLPLETQNICSPYTLNLTNNDKEKGLNSIGATTIKRKDPRIAFALAFFPGFFVHGLGHYYIGKEGTGTLLLGAGLLSVLVVYGAAISGIASMENKEEPKQARTLAFIAVTLFYGSWAYDFIGAPIRAEKMNKEHGYAFYVYPKIESEYISINIAFSVE